jgi:hypothetical protein
MSRPSIPFAKRLYFLTLSLALLLLASQSLVDAYNPNPKPPPTKHTVKISNAGADD